MKTLIVINFLFQIIIAKANAASLIFFGGHGVSTEQIKAWEAGVRSSPSLNMDLTFRGVVYPSNSPRYSEAIQDGNTQINSIVKEINAASEKNFILVGHSSGSALAIEISKKGYHEILERAMETERKFEV